VRTRIIRASEAATKEKAPPRDPDAEAVFRALKNPRAAAKAFLKFDAERSLLNYTKLVWPVIEPGQPLVVSPPLEAMCEHLEAVSNGQIRRLLINVPPGFSKSTEVGVMWPSWEWGPRDRSDLRMISWSYAAHLTERDNEKCRNLIQSPLYQALWGNRFELDAKQNTKAFYKTSRKGVRIATSIDGVGTGERADRLTLDDPHSVLGGDSEADLRNVTNFFGGTFNSRIRNADDRVKVIDGLRAEPSTIVIIMQRVSSKDVSGLIIANELEFEHLMIEMEYEGSMHPRRRMTNWKPSRIAYEDPRGPRVAEMERVLDELRLTPADERDWIWQMRNVFAEIALDICKLADPVRFPRHVIERDKKIMALKQGTSAVASQFRQWPFDTSGADFKREWFEGKTITLAQLRTAEWAPMGDDIRGWDFAAKVKLKNDRTATVLMRMTVERKVVIMHARAERLTPGGVEKLVASFVVSDREMGWSVRPSIPIDPGQAGESQLAAFTKGVFMGVAFDATREVNNKRTRWLPLAAQAEHGNVFIVEGSWNEEFLSELCSVPVGDHDDLADAASRAYDGLIRLVLGLDEESWVPKLIIG
jgi:predicted phage terminase large subunit-like protein